jgi:hypothetical protein
MNRHKAATMLSVDTPQLVTQQNRQITSNYVTKDGRKSEILPEKQQLVQN